MSGFTAAPTTADAIPAACRALFSHLPPAERDAHTARLLDLITRGEIDPAGLFVARCSRGELCAAMLAQALPGALGLAWPPRTQRRPDRLAAEDTLVQAACAWLQSRGVKVCQVFVAGHERPDAVPLERHGFRHVTHVSYMRCPVPPGGPAELISPFVLQPFTADPAWFTELLTATYEGSLDCPELSGTRTPTELLDGFRGHGSTGEWWYRVEAAGTPVGVVIWELPAGSEVMELSYLGLVPAARGRGLGAALVRESFRFARGHGAHTLLLTVDGRNEPAVRLYHQHGFREEGRHDVLLASWPAESTTSRDHDATTYMDQSRSKRIN